jgi:hypothetical protein
MDKFDEAWKTYVKRAAESNYVPSAFERTIFMSGWVAGRAELLVPERSDASS